MKLKWYRNPFFHTAVLPPSVAPSVVGSTRPSADLESATAAAVAARVAAANLHREAEAEAPRASIEPPLAGRRSDAGRTSPSDHTPHGILTEAANRVAQQQQRQHHVHISRNSMFRARRREPKVPKLTICEPSSRLTGYQFFYIFILDGLGAFVLSGGINFAIAYAMYKTIDATKHPIRLFQFPNTIAGDATVTVFIQCVITWFIELILVNRDLSAGQIQPIGFLPEPKSALLRWFLLLDRRPDASSSASASAAGGAHNSDSDDIQRPLSAPHDENCRCGDENHHAVERYEPGSLGHWVVFLVSQLIRALLIGVAVWLLMWGPAMGIMTAVGDYHDGDYWFTQASWAPTIFKLVYGGVLAMLTTPPFAAFWLVRCGWALQANQRHLDAGEAAAMAADDGDDSTVRASQRLSAVSGVGIADIAEDPAEGDDDPDDTLPEVVVGASDFAKAEEADKAEEAGETGLTGPAGTA